MDTLKQVRVRKIVEGANTGSLDLRVLLLQGTASSSQRIARGQVSLSGQIYWSEVTYDGPRYQDKTNDQILQEYIASNSEIEANRIGSKLGSSLFKIVQNPWADEVPQLRKFGEDPYYLNNGAYINISWRKYLEVSYAFEAYYVYGNGTASDPTRILVDTALFLDGSSPSDIDVELPNFFELNYKTSGTGSVDEFYGVTLSQVYTIDSALTHAQNVALTEGFGQGTGDYVVSISGNYIDLTLPKQGPSGFTRNISGYEYSDETLKEVNTPSYIYKSFFVVPNPLQQPSIDEPNEEYERFWSFDDKYTPRYLLEFAGGITNSVIPLSITYSYEVKDEVIVNNIIENWVKSLSTAYPSAKTYNLKQASPSYTYPTTDLINDYSPKKNFTEAGKVFKWEQVGDNPNVLTPNPATGASGSVIPPAATQSNVELIKLNPVFPENWMVKTDEPAPEFSIWVGDIEADVPVEGFVFSDETDDLSGLSPEFLEEAFIGEDEQIEFNLTDPNQAEFGESGGSEEDIEGQTTTTATETTATETAATTPVAETEVLSKTATDSASKGGGTGDKRFQQKLTVSGRTVYNGDLPANLLTKLDFCGHKIEKNAVKKLNELNKAYKAQFGKDLQITDGYRTFNVQNKIFDWNYYDTGLNPYTKKVDPKNKGRKVGSFKQSKPTGVAAAPPGTSKHGWGQAVDIGGFGNGPGNKYFEWMEENARKFGWINPAWAKKAGAGYEPWHWEYNGADLFKA